MCYGRELLADETSKPFARVHAQAGAHLLNHDERHRDENHQEQSPIAELRAGARICENPTRRSRHWLR